MSGHLVLTSKDPISYWMTLCRLPPTSLCWQRSSLRLSRDSGGRQEKGHCAMSQLGMWSSEWSRLSCPPTLLNCQQGNLSLLPVELSTHHFWQLPQEWWNLSCTAKFNVHQIVSMPSIPWLLEEEEVFSMKALKLVPLSIRSSAISQSSTLSDSRRILESTLLAKPSAWVLSTIGQCSEETP